MKREDIRSAQGDLHRYVGKDLYMYSDSHNPSASKYWGRLRPKKYSIFCLIIDIFSNTP